MKILFITEIAPFPINGGEKLRSYGLMKLMSSLNFNVHAIIGKSSINNSPGMDIDGIKYYPFDFYKNRSFRKLKSYHRLMSCNPELISLINSILQHDKMDVAFIDYSFYGQYIAYFQHKGIPVIYGTHNAQAALVKQRPVISFRSNISKFTDYLLSKLHETYYFRKADALVVVSENDKRYHGSFVKKDKLFIIPNFLVESEYNSLYREKENYVLMTANFKAFQNAYGLEWFIREVWDNDLWNKTRLLLVGLGSIEIYNILKEKYNLTNVSAVGEVDDLKPYISKARISIVPLLHGSGSRLKCLESMALKTQLISTTKGAEGIDHKNSIVLADTPAEFKHALLKFIDLKTDFTEKAYEAFIEKYSLNSNRIIFARIINAVVK